LRKRRIKETRERERERKEEKGESNVEKWNARSTGILVSRKPSKEERERREGGETAQRERKRSRRKFTCS